MNQRHQYCLFAALIALSPHAPIPPCAAEVIRVRILVDEEEATLPRVWQQRLTARLEKASAIISRYADVRFAVQSFGTWKSDDRLQDFSRTLREFEQEVDADPAQIAIGFSSQYKFQPGRNNLGGTHGPLRAHILIRENARTVLEPERLEVLVHELGHFLCAAHSASPRSVMRPVVGDGIARAKSFQIAFDPDNAQIIKLVGRELRDRNIRAFQHISTPTLTKLRPSYVRLAKASPRDETSQRYLQNIDALLAYRKARQPVIGAGRR